MEPDNHTKLKPVIRICDFFSGTHSWTHPWIEWGEAHGYEVRVFSIDNNQAYSQDTTVIMDFMELNAEMIREHLGGNPDLILASPPCTAFSVASIGTHWTGGRRAYIPATEFAKLSLKLIEKLFQLIDELEPRFYWIENPRGVLRKLKVMERENLSRTTVWYCQYGSTLGVKRAKPTDLWGVWPDTWTPRAPCKNGNPDCDHVRAPRGAKTGTQGLSGNKARSMIPTELTGEIQEAVALAMFPELQLAQCVDTFPAPAGTVCDQPGCDFKAVQESTWKYWTEDGWILAGRYSCVYCMNKEGMK
jgi:hypothetical protein